MAGLTSFDKKANKNTGGFTKKTTTKTTAKSGGQTKSSAVVPFTQKANTVTKTTSNGVPVNINLPQKVQPFTQQAQPKYNLPTPKKLQPFTAEALNVPKVSTKAGINLPTATKLHDKKVDRAFNRAFAPKGLPQGKFSDREYSKVKSASEKLKDIRAGVNSAFTGNEQTIIKNRVNMYSESELQNLVNKSAGKSARDKQLYKEALRIKQKNNKELKNREKRDYALGSVKYSALSDRELESRLQSTRAMLNKLPIPTQANNNYGYLNEADRYNAQRRAELERQLGELSAEYDVRSRKGATNNPSLDKAFRFGNEPASKGFITNDSETNRALKAQGYDIKAQIDPKLDKRAGNIASSVSYDKITKRKREYEKELNSLRNKLNDPVTVEMEGQEKIRQALRKAQENYTLYSAAEEYYKRRLDKATADKYNKLLDNSNFAKNTAPKTESEKILLSDFNTIEKYREEYEASQSRGQALRSAGGFGITKSTLNSDEYLLSYGTQKQIRTYIGLKNTKGNKAAKEYLDFISPKLNQTKALRENKKDVDFVKSSPVAPAVATAIGVGGKLASTPTALMDTVAKTIEEKISGQPVNIDTNSDAYRGMRRQENYTGQITKNMSPVGRALYETGLSIADNMLSVALGAVTGSPGLSLYIMSSEAAAGGAYDAVRRGATPSQALAYATEVGLTEYLTEKIGVDRLFSIGEGKVKGLIKAVLPQIVTEGTEEVISNVIENSLDRFTLGDKSNYYATVRQYINDGYSRTEAENKAFFDLYVADSAKSFLMAALSGGIMGAGAYGINTVGGVAGNIAQKREFKNRMTEEIGRGIRQNGDVSAFVNDAVNSAGNVRDLNYANRVRNNLENGKDVSNYELGRIFNNMVEDETQRKMPITSDFLRSFSDKHGVNIELDENLQDGAEGLYIPETNTIKIAPNATRADVIKGVFMHELTHFIENSEHYGNYKSFALDALRNNGIDIEEAKRNKIEQYARHNQSLTPEQAEAELVAQYTRNNLFTNEADIRRLVQSNYQLGQRIYNKIVETINKVKSTLGISNITDTSRYAELKQLEEGRKLFQKCLNEAKEGTALSDNKIKFLIKENDLIGKVAFLEGAKIKRKKGEAYNSAIKRFFNENFKNQIINVGDTNDNIKLDQIGKYLYSGAGLSNYNLKRSAVSILDEMIEIGNNKSWNKNLRDKNGNVKKHSGYDCSNGFNYYDTQFALDKSGIIYGGTIIARIDKNGKIYFYDLDNIREVGYQDENDFYPAIYSLTSLNDNNIPQTNPNVKKNNSGSFSFAEEETQKREYTPAQKQARELIKNSIAKELNIKRNAENNQLLEAFVDTALDEISQNGALSDSSIESIVDVMADRGIITDNDMGETYSDLKKQLQSTPIYVSEQIRNDITDYGSFRRSLYQALKLSNNNGIPVDSLYEELSDVYPELFSDEIINPSDRLQRIAEVAQELKTKNVSPKQYYGTSYNEAFRTPAVQNIKEAVNRAYYGMQTAEATAREYDKKLESKERQNEKLREENKQLKKDKQRISNKVLEEAGYNKLTPPEPVYEVSDNDNKVTDTDAEYAELFKTVGDFEAYDSEETEKEINDAFDKYGSEEEEFTPQIEVSSPVYVNDFMQKDPDETARGILATLKFLYNMKKEIDKLKKRLNLTANELKWVKRIVDGENEADIPQWFKDTNKYDQLIEYMKLYKDAKESGSLERQKKLTAENLKQKVDELTAGAFKWKSKKTGFQFERETFERNLRDIMPEEEANRIIDWFYRPYLENESNKIRFSNELAKRVKALGLSEDESAYTQMVGEGVMELTDVPEQSRQKVENAVEEFRSIYKILKDEINKQLVLNGYKPIDSPKLKLNARETAVAMNVLSGGEMPATAAKGIDLDKINQFVRIAQRNGVYDFNDNAQGKMTATVEIPYFPHFSEDDPVIKAFKKLGYNFDVTPLPGDITGRSADFKPGKKWFGNILKREGANTVYDAVAGFDRYIAGAGDVIYHTSDIKKLRGLIASLRETFSKEAVSEETSRQRALAYEAYVQGDEDSEYYGKTPKNLSEQNNLINWLENYANIIAGKKSVLDRGFEYGANRGIYNVISNMSNRLATNLTSSFSTVLNQFSQITDVLAENNPIDVLMALHDMSFLGENNADYRNKSDFLTRRKGTDRLRKSKVDKYTDMLFTPSRKAEDIVSMFVQRTKYNELIRKGMSEEEAMRTADEYAASIMADRVKGALPTIFNSKNPFVRAMAMFQVESNNYFSHITKDLPREGKTKGRGWLVRTYAFTALANWLFNTLMEKIKGQRPLPDPVEVAKTAFEVAMKKEGKDIEDLKDALLDLGTSFVPFAQAGLTLLGSDAGRVPMQELLPKRDGTFDWIEDVADPLGYLFMPGGYSQLKKTGLGAKAIYDKGVYSKNGNLKYEAGTSPWNITQNLIFGRSSTAEAREYFDSFDNKKGSDKGKGNPDHYDGLDSDFKDIYETYVESQSTGDGTEYNKLFQKYLDEGYDGYYVAKKVREMYNDEYGTGTEKTYSIMQEPPKNMVDLINLNSKPDFSSADYVAKKLKIDPNVYADIKNGVSKIKSDKDVFGDSISYSAQVSKKLLIDEYADDLSDEQREALYKAFGINEKVWEATPETKQLYTLPYSKQDVAKEAHDEYGISYSEFTRAYNAVSGIYGDKDENGKTIYLSASRKKKDKIDNLFPNMSDEQREALYDMAGVSEKVWRYNLPSKSGGKGRRRSRRGRKSGGGSSNRMPTLPKANGVILNGAGYSPADYNLPSYDLPSYDLPQRSYDLPNYDLPTYNLPSRADLPTYDLPTYNLP